MIKKGLEIRYGDVAPEAKENFYPASNDSEFETLEQLQKYNLNFTNYANPCEMYSVVLDGMATAFPSTPEDVNLGLWSNKISNDDGIFEEPIVLELESAGQYSSQGLTLTFDTYNDIYATRLGIKWLRITDEGINVLAEDEFQPTSSFYFCRKKVDNYNKIVITFYSMNMPKNRLKLRAIDYGYGTVFEGKELRNTKLIQELNPISTEISINTVDFSLDSKTDMEYSFQAKQPLSLYYNGKLRATTFVKSSKRKSKFLWDIQSEDYIGIMDSISFYGDIYNGKDAYELLEEIFAVAKVPYSINENLKGVLVYGFIPISTCREALMQVAFAVQNVVDTSDSDVVKVYELEQGVKQTIPLDRIMQGQNFVDEETVTGVEVSVHSYKQIRESMTVYDAKESGIGENIIVKFPEPLHKVRLGVMEEDEGDEFFVEDSSVGSIVFVGTNYAIINVYNENCVVIGRKYEHTVQIQRKNNPIVSASEIEKIVSVENATLVSSHNIDNVMEKCYNWLVRSNSTNLKIREGKHIEYGQIVKYGQAKYGTMKYKERFPNVITYDEPINVGDIIKAETEYLGIVEGTIIKQSFNLNGNIIIKEAVLK